MSTGLDCAKGRVKAVFPHSTLQFDVAADMTLGNLCALLANWGRGHGEAVLVEFAWLPPPSEGRGLQGRRVRRAEATGEGEDLP
jgi:hypothetical protein